MGCLQDPLAGVGLSQRGRRAGADVGNRTETESSQQDHRPSRRRDSVSTLGAESSSSICLSNYFEPTKPEFLDPQQLCLPLGPVRQLTWHDVHILQYPGYVIFEHEGGHVFRSIPLG